MASYISIGEPVNHAERAGIRMLRDLLPDHFTVIGNFELQLPRRRNTLEFDAVVVGEHGLFAVEIKGWRGPIQGDIRHWRLDWGRVQNPLILIEQKAKALRQYLGEQLEEVPDGLFCEAVVLLPLDDVELLIEDPRRQRILTRDDIYSFFVDRFLTEGPGALLDPTRLEAVMDRITPVARPRSVQLEIPGYELEGELETDGSYREFFGRHALLSSRNRVRIKMYQIDPLLHPKEKKEQYDRILRDLEALARLEENPYVARAYEAIEDRSDQHRVFLISEWVSSTTLREVIEQESVSTVRRRQLARDLVEAMHFVHQKAIVHRNLHPGAVYLRDDASKIALKVADFDCARVENLPSIAGGMEEIGTVGYVAPELWSQSGPYDHRVDIFSLGVIIWELLTRRRLFSSIDDMLNHQLVWQKNRTVLDDSGLQALLDQMVTSKPEDRLDSLAPLADYLDRQS